MKNAGFEIIADAITDVRGKEGVCLGYKKTSFGDEWVTWGFTNGLERSYYWGHYFRSEEDAFKDYYKRAIGYMNQSLDAYIDYRTVLRG